MNKKNQLYLLGLLMLMSIVILTACSSEQRVEAVIEPESESESGLEESQVSEPSIEESTENQVSESSIEESTENQVSESSIEESIESQVSEANVEESIESLIAGPSVNGSLQILEVGGMMQVCNKEGEPIQLRGMSTHGLQWFPEIINNNAFRGLKEDWEANVIRLAMYVEEGGYNTRPQVKELVIQGIDLAIANDMYVIVDWHVHDPGDPMDDAYSGAIDFFDEISSLYPNNESIIYELANEPNSNNGGVTNDYEGWKKVKTFCEPIVKMLRDKGNENLVIVGSPNWSQRPDLAADNPIEDDHICYSFHFYAGTHKAEMDTSDPSNLMGNVQNALDKGVAVFASEWGTSQANGSLGVYLDNASLWIDYMNRNNISWVNWSLTNKDESSAAFIPYNMGYTDATDLDPGEDGAWALDELSESGEYVRSMIKGDAYKAIERVTNRTKDTSVAIGSLTFPSDFDDGTRQGWAWAGESGIKGKLLIEEVDGSKAICFDVEFPEDKPADGWASGGRMVLREVNVLKEDNAIFSYNIYLEAKRASVGRVVAYLAFAPPSMGYWVQPMEAVTIELSELANYEEVSDGIYKIHAVFDLEKLKEFKKMRPDTEIRDITIVIADEESDFIGRVYIDSIQFGE